MACHESCCCGDGMKQATSLTLSHQTLAPDPPTAAQTAAMHPTPAIQTTALQSSLPTLHHTPRCRARCTVQPAKLKILRSTSLEEAHRLVAASIRASFHSCIGAAHCAIGIPRICVAHTHQYNMHMLCLVYIWSKQLIAAPADDSRRQQRLPGLAICTLVLSVSRKATLTSIGEVSYEQHSRRAGGLQRTVDDMVESGGACICTSATLCANGKVPVSSERGNADFKHLGSGFAGDKLTLNLRLFFPYMPCNTHLSAPYIDIHTGPGACVIARSTPLSGRSHVWHGGLQTSSTMVVA